MSQSPQYRWWLGAAAVAILVAGAVWLALQAWGRSFQWELFSSTLKRLDFGWIGFSGILALATYLGRALRWRVLIRSQKSRPNLWNLFTGTAIGFTAIVLLGRPGEMVRPYLIGLKEKLSFSSQMAAWLVERMYDLMMALLIFGLALSQVRGSGVKVGEGLRWVLAVGGYVASGVALLCVVLFIALRQFGSAGEHRINDAATMLPERYRGWVARAAAAFTQGVESTRDWRSVSSAVAYSILEWMLIVGCYACIFRASPATAEFGWMDVLIFVGFVSFGSIVQIPGVGGGMQIVTVAVLTELFGMPLEVSSGLALVLWAITFVVIVPIGLLLAFHDGIKWGKLRQIGAEAGD